MTAPPPPPRRFPARRWLLALLCTTLIGAGAVAVWLGMDPVRTPFDAASASFANIPRPGAPPDPPGIRHGALPSRAALSQVLRLLRESHDRTAPVRILFYGQSITEQGWWKHVVAYLRATYPQAALQIENRAIGGHGAGLLRKTAEADVYPFQPDLVIFHVYGSHHDYEALIRAMREQTTADVIVATDHITRDAELDEDTQPLRLDLRAWLYRVPHLASATTRLANWTAWMNYSFLPALAERHHLQRVDVRDRWKAYLASHHLRAGDLLRDEIHLNDEGQFLMAEIVKPYLAPEDPVDAGRSADDRIVQIAPISPPAAPGQPVRIVFNGTRIDALPANAAASPVPVTVDGQPPCSLPGARRFDRVTAYPGSNWPALLRIQPGPAAPLEETWTLTLLQADDALKRLRFSVSGSKTGPDGQGDSLARFTSDSQRLVIDPDDWDLAYGRTVLRTPVPAGFQVRWRSICRGTDALPAGLDASAAPVTLVQGLVNGEHVLQLPPAAAASLRGVRVYRPAEARR